METEGRGVRGQSLSWCLLEAVCWVGAWSGWPGCSQTSFHVGSLTKKIDRWIGSYIPYSSVTCDDISGRVVSLQRKQSGAMRNIMGKKSAKSLQKKSFQIMWSTILLLLFTSVVPFVDGMSLITMVLLKIHEDLDFLSGTKAQRLNGTGSRTYLLWVQLHDQFFVGLLCWTVSWCLNTSMVPSCQGDSGTWWWINLLMVNEVGNIHPHSHVLRRF